MTRAELHNLAVAFRTNDPNLKHVDTFNTIAKIGGAIAIHYGYWTAESFRRSRQGRVIANEIAYLLDQKAESL